MRVSSSMVFLSLSWIAPAIAQAPLVAPVAPVLSDREAVRFLDHSSFGPTAASIAAVRHEGIAAYLKDQFSTAATGYPGYAYLTADQMQGCPTRDRTCLRDNYSIFPVQMQFYRNALTGPDQLRQRVAFALSQIFVVSGTEILQPYGMAAYQRAGESVFARRPAQ